MAQMRGALPPQRKIDKHAWLTFARMGVMREEGWCVVLKCLPTKLGWIIEGARSEYDAPCDDKTIGVGKWCCGASWMGEIGYRPSATAFGDDPWEAVHKVFDQTREAMQRPLQAILP